VVSATPEFAGDIERAKAELDQGADVAVRADMQPASEGRLRSALGLCRLGRRSAFDDPEA